jgi:hypothetical protein
MEQSKFFTLNNWRFFLKEVVKMYSSSSSFFSMKRIKSGIAFIIGQFGMIYWLLININKADINDICMWAAVEFTICGYVINHIQKEKIHESHN